MKQFISVSHLQIMRQLLIYPVKFLLFNGILFLLTTLTSFAQETFPVNGVQDKQHIYYAFTNVKIFVDYQTTIENGTLLIKDGMIEKAGADVFLPKGAVIYDMKGRFIYPSLIDIYTTYGMPVIEKKKRVWAPQMQSKTKGAFNWNQAIKPETDASKLFTVDAKGAEEMRKMGFGAVLSFQKDGIARGSSVFVLLGEGKENQLIIKSRASAHYSFSKGSSTQSYPSSLMGTIALLRQTYLDADWYKNNRDKRESNISLDAWNKLQDIPQIFEAGDKLSVLRADKVGDEFNVQYVIKGSTNGYERIDEIKATRAAFILPLNFPKPYDVEDPYDALLVSLKQMKHWELAPSNLSWFEQKNIPFAITMADLKDKKVFWKNLRKAIEHGLSEKQALKSLTYTPAKLLRVSDKTGSLRKGMIANFIITSGNLFDEKNVIYENWIQGKQYKINDIDAIDIRGNYDLSYASETYEFSVKGELTKPKGSIEVISSVSKKDTVYIEDADTGEKVEEIKTIDSKDTTKIKVNISLSGNLIGLNFTIKKDDREGTIRLSGNVDDKKWSGRGQLPTGDWIEWTVVKKSDYEDKEKKDTAQISKPQIGDVFYPNMAYGWKVPPKRENVLIKNATVWTNESEGILKGTDVLMVNGKITKIGKNIQPPTGTKIVDATGMHLSAGIVDEHSHIAISSGVNEGAQAVSAEVSIADVIRSNDINIYRQLAGGVTTAQLLHGSANPIGGQSGLIKFRWGASPEAMKFKGGDGFIKFALGENVKQSNWGDMHRVRFPQTRMGVEQLFYDAFTRAREYEAKWKKYNGLSSKQKVNTSPPRKDLELETLVEILNSKRFVTCHSYTQAEINMLMHVADSMGFKINTFTHILEGYKVADKMKAHGVGASTFSDWWAYKFEVNDAIPYNGAILNSMGVITAYNSDDAEMGRRLNQEAAKAVKYGGVSQEEALKFVTLNPAKLLHIDNRVGSIKVGKDADVVLWTDNPLSVYAKVEKTYVDGILYYDVERDKLMREEILKERARLIQKMIKDKKGGGKTQKPMKKKEMLYRCDTVDENL